MKKTTLLLFGALCLLCASCEKEEDNYPYYNYNSGSNTNTNQGTTTKQTGTIQCINNTSDSYRVEIKGNTPYTYTLQGGYYRIETVEYGYYSITVTQLDGYILYPTVNKTSGYVNSSNNKMVYSWY